MIYFNKKKIKYNSFLKFFYDIVKHIFLNIHFSTSKLWRF